MPPAKTKESVTPILWEDIQDPLADFVGVPVKNYSLKVTSVSLHDVPLKNAAIPLVTFRDAVEDRPTMLFTCGKNKRQSTYMALWKGNSDAI